MSVIFIEILSHTDTDGNFLDKWLTRRLTPAKKLETRWLELSQTLEKFWEQNFDPKFSRLERLRSSYQSDDADLARKIRQMGDYFSMEIPPKEVDRPVALAWRRLELEYKDMELILRSVFRRHFGDFSVAWYPVFASETKPYGSDFIVSDYFRNDWTKNIPPKGYFLTSRGIVVADKIDLYRNRLTKQAFIQEAIPIAVRTKPLHIVLDGLFYFIQHDLGLFNTIYNIEWHSDTSSELYFSPVGTRFDYLAADTRRVDVDVFNTTSISQNTLAIVFWRDTLWRLDMFLHDGFGNILPEDMRMDIARPGVELETVQHFSVPFTEHKNSIYYECVSIIPHISLAETEQKDVFILVKQNEIEQLKNEHSNKISVKFWDNAIFWHLDMFVPDGFCNILPKDMKLDIAIPGNEFEKIAQLPVIFTEHIINDYGYCFNVKADVHLSSLDRDNTPMSIPTLEIESLQKDISRNVTVFKFWQDVFWHLDMFLSDSFNSDMLPVDTVLPGIEYQNLSHFLMPFTERTDTSVLKVISALPDVHLSSLDRDNTPMSIPTLEIESLWTQESKPVFVAFYEDEIPLDRLPRFDEIGADYVPLDYPYGGFV